MHWNEYLMMILSKKNDNKFIGANMMQEKEN